MIRGSSCALLLALASTAVAQAPTTGRGPAALQGRVDALGDPLPAGAVARFGTLRLRHGGEAILAFTPDGQHLLSVGADQAWQRWAAESGKELRRFAHSSLNLHATAGGVVVLRAGGQVVVQHQAGHQGAAPLGVAFTPGGQWLASATDKNTAIVWDPATGEEVRSFSFQFPGGHALAFSRDGSLLAGGDSSGEEHVIRIWDRAQGQEVRTLKGLGPVSRLLFSPDQRHLAGVELNQVRLWHVASGKRERVYQGHAQFITGLTFAPDGKLLAAAAADGIRIWETASEEEVGKLVADEGGFVCLAFAPDSRTLASGSPDGVVRLWDTVAGKETRSFQQDANAVNALAWSPDGRTLASASALGALCLWDVATGKEKPLPRLPGGVQRAGPRPDGSLFLTLEDGSTILGSWDQGRVARRLARPAFKGTLLGTSCDGKYQAWLDERDKFVLWHADEAKAALELETAPAGVAFSPDGQFFALIAQDDTVTVWKTETMKEVRRLARVGKVSLLCFSASGRTLAAVNVEKGEIGLWELSSGRQYGRIPGPGNGLSCMAFAPDGGLLAGGGSDEMIRCWDTLSGRLVRGLVGQRGQALALDFSPRGDRLASGGEDGSVRVWDVRSGAEQLCFQGHRGAVQTVAFAADGRQLVSGGKDTTALVWDLEVGGAPPPDRRAQDRPLEPLWASLGDEDATVAYAALGELAALPNEAVPFLRDRLSPVTRVPADELARRVAGLDDARYAVREKATHELEKLEGQAVAALRAALARQPSPEAATRMEALLARFEAPLNDPHRLRALRAVELLERIGTPAASALLQTLAAGAPDARLTREAQAAWQRWRQRQGKQ